MADEQKVQDALIHVNFMEPDIACHINGVVFRVVGTAVMYQSYGKRNIPPNILAFKDLCQEEQEAIRAVLQNSKQHFEEYIKRHPDDPNNGIPDIIQALTLIFKGAQGRRSSSKGLAKLQPITQPVTFTTQTHLTGMMLDAASSKTSDWIYHSSIESYALKTKHGMAIIKVSENAFDELKWVLERFGPAGLQFTVAALHHITDAQKSKHGCIPKWEDVTPTRLGCSDLLRSMGKYTGKYSGFTREQQLKASLVLCAADRFKWVDIKPTHDGKARVDYGPLVNVLNTELLLKLPFDDLPDKTDEVLSVDVMPGKAVWEDIRKHGLGWFHPMLLKYDAKDEKFEIMIGFYIGQQMINKRNKANQNYLSLETIERESGVISFDSNERRRLPRIEKALNRLARDGVIPGRTNGEGAVVAMIDNPDAGKTKKLKAADARRRQLVRIKPIPELES